MFGEQTNKGGKGAMSKKHFEALADRIACIEDVEARKEAALAVADVCAGCNGRFDRWRFLRACGVELN